ncbi:hypothetical protein ACFE04_017181 [Oxalis oulophora]
MIIGEFARSSSTTVQIPRWDPLETTNGHLKHLSSPSVNINGSNNYVNDFSLTPQQRYGFTEFDSLSDSDSDDYFRMYEFKIRPCVRGRSHDWTECPYAHHGEKARRRDPRKYNYSGAPCSEFRKGNCSRGDQCESAHGVFECWLHPTRYRTQPCKDGVACNRKICFFAHTADQLRFEVYGNSPTSILASSPFFHSSESPPLSPSAYHFNSVDELANSMRRLQVKNSLFGSGSMLRPRVSQRDMWKNMFEEDEPVMERVESGRDLRTKMYAKLSKENSLD